MHCCYGTELIRILTGIQMNLEMESRCIVSLFQRKLHHRAACALCKPQSVIGYDAIRQVCVIDAIIIIAIINRLLTQHYDCVDHTT